MHSLDVAVAAGQVACIVSVCLLATLVFPAKRVNWLRCRLGCRLRWAQGTMLGGCHIHLPRSPPPTRRDGFGSFWPFVKQWDFLLHTVQQSITAVTLNSPLYEKSTPCDVAYSQFLGIFVLITRCCCFLLCIWLDITAGVVILLFPGICRVVENPRSSGKWNIFLSKPQVFCSLNKSYGHWPAVYCCSCWWGLWLLVH